MAATPGYAATPYVGAGITTTADTSYTAPTNSTVGVIATANSSGARIDSIQNVTTGTSVAGVHRIWLCEGTPGATITTITFSTTTATATTSTAHGLTTGNLITLQGAFPLDYNVKNVAITVTSATAFTYTMGTAPTVNATTVGQYSSTPATATYHLQKETVIASLTGSTTVAATTYALTTQLNPEFMPLFIPPGWSLRTTVSVTQTNGMKTTAFGGQY